MIKLTQREQEMENEANVFAACILIPKDMILKDVKEGIDLTDDAQLNQLCKKYRVTMTTMAFRLAILKEAKLIK